jgi:uncharacterized protein YjiS (DUF1127 family)
MCDYPKLRSAAGEPIRKSMQVLELKQLVESGNYKPDPSQIANAMLQRRGVRELLVLSDPAISRVGRSHSPAGFPRRAA